MNKEQSSLGIPVITLSNGVRVANFSSPHSFTFVDGSVLPACSPERSKQMELTCSEQETVVDIPDSRCDEKSWNVMSYIKVTELKIDWRLTFAVDQELSRLLWNKKFCDQFDVLLVPLPVMTALKEGNREIGKARCVRMADRVTKAAHIDRFCI